MDLARGLCILLVILGHAAYVTRDIAGLSFAQSFKIFNDFMDPFRIPFLMFLSGMLLHKSLGKPTREYVLGKFHLIFWPFLIWSLATYAAEDRFTVEYVLKTPFTAPSVLWYLWFLCAYYIIALGLIRFSVPLVPVIIVCIIASGLLPSVLRIDRFAALLAFFLAGHYVVSQNWAERITPPIAVMGLAAAIAGGVYSAMGHPIKYNPLFVWVPMGLIMFVLWASAFYKPSAASAPFEWIGRNSIVFYAAHFPTLVFTARMLAPDPAWNGSLFYGLIFAWALSVGAMLQLLRERLPIFAALFDFRPILKMLPAKSAPSAQEK
jgi:fucose 4-O-acetylase-like acetyltransferase